MLSHLNISLQEKKIKFLYTLRLIRCLTDVALIMRRMKLILSTRVF